MALIGSVNDVPFFVMSARAGSAGERPLSASARCFVLKAAGVKYAIARKAMQIAADICVYTNHNFVVEKLEAEPAQKLLTDELR